MIVLVRATMLALVVAGCAEPSARLEHDAHAVRIGDAAVYRHVGGDRDFTVAVGIVGTAEVRDAAGTLVETVIQRRWVNGSMGGPSLLYFDAVDVNSGGYVVSMLVCTGQDRAACGENILSFFAIEQLPFLVEQDGRRRDCSERTSPAFHAYRGFGYTPFGFMAGESYSMCFDETYPRSIALREGGHLVREWARRGAGGPVEILTSMREVESSSSVLRDEPPDHTWPGDGFLLSEALAWAEANSAEFQKFARDHPDMRIRSFINEGSGDGTIGPQLHEIQTTRLHQRRLELETDEGTVLTLRFERQRMLRDIDEIRQVEASLSTSLPHLERSPTPFSKEPAELTRDFVQRTGFAWTSTDYTSAGPDDAQEDPRARSLYLMRVFASPADAPMFGLSPMGVLRADSARYVFAFAPPEFVSIHPDDLSNWH